MIPVVSVHYCSDEGPLDDQYEGVTDASLLRFRSVYAKSVNGKTAQPSQRSRLDYLDPRIL